MTDYMICPAPDGDKRDEWQRSVAIQETIPREKVDYAVGRPDAVKRKVPLSFAQLQNEEQAKEWYHQNHPEFPDQVLSVMAHRLSIDRGWVEAEAKATGFTIERKPVTVNLD